MPVKRFWPPTKHKLLCANLLLYFFLIILWICFHDDLIWAQKTLRGYLLTGQLDPPASNQLMIKALALPPTGEKARMRLQLFNEAYQIDPYSLALVMLGDYYLDQDKEKLALAYYERFRRVDPSFIDVYKKMARIMTRNQDKEELLQLLDEGINYFRQRVALYQPHYDPSVPEEFNAKAFKIYNLSKEALKDLREIKKEVSHEAQE